MFLNSLLKDLGFNENEISTYNALLNFKNLHKASEIAKIANINRSTCYIILGHMHKKGLCNMKKENGVRYFGIKHPIKENLYEYIQKEKLRINENEKKLNRLLPIIEKNETFISSYNGLEEVKNMYEDTLNAQTEVLSFINPNNIDKHLLKFLNRNIFEKRLSQKIKSYCISNKLVKNERENILNYYDKKIFIPEEIFPFTSDISIYDNKVLLGFWQEKELTGMIIQNKNFSNMMKSIFGLCSQITEKF